ncbi:MAG: pyridoxamine 5'-phosphate oxidase family protein [Acidimicrobiia bacterium]|nr:pyridoxamine 5'-phosphate oxidase family protein [Acidimicrobiia bacterium]
MASWAAVEEQAPQVAGLARAACSKPRGLAMLATLRADGSPRISGIEPLIAGGELWLGMMAGSRKGSDLERDSRFALHNASEDKEVTEGDAKVSGRAVEVTADEEKQAFLRAFEEANRYAPSDTEDMQLFRADVTEVTTIRPSEDHLDIDTWRQGRGISRVDRY